MSKQDRIFADDWRDCLREQFKYVIRQRDVRTQATLTQILHEMGFGDDELDGLRLEATLRAEDLPDDYMPEEVQQQFYAGIGGPQAVPVEIVENAAPLADDTDKEVEPEPATFDELLTEEPAETAEGDEPEPEEDADAPQQLSLF